MKRLQSPHREKRPNGPRKTERLLQMASAILLGKNRKIAVVLEDGIKELHREITKPSK